MRVLAEFTAITSLEWSRIVNDISEASLTVDTLRCGCEWLADVRAARHELVIFRQIGTDPPERVWEGPIVRVTYRAGFVEIEARDVLWWLTRRSHRGRFTDDGQNAVEEAATAIKSAFTYDNPNVTSFLRVNARGGEDVTIAVNRHEGTYYDTLSDLVDAGVFHTALGRSIMVWDQHTPPGRTPMLRSPGDLNADIAVVEEGATLATRVIEAGNDTYGSNTPEPVIVNHAFNPSLEVSGSYWQVPRAEVIPFDMDGDGRDDDWLNLGQHTSWSRVKSSTGSGSWAGQVLAEPPVKPKPIGPEAAKPKAPARPVKGGMSDAAWKVVSAQYEQDYADYKHDLRIWTREHKSYSSDVKGYNRRVSQYNARLRSFRDAETVIYSTQQLACHEGQLVGANLTVWQVGPRESVLGLRLVGIDSDGELADRAFQEGPPIRCRTATDPVMLFVKGPVPKDTVKFRVEVYRDTDKTKWPTDDCGFRFDKFGLWDQGRVETWFDGDSKTVSVPSPLMGTQPPVGVIDYSWNGAPDASSSTARFSNPKVDPIYGLIETLVQDPTARTGAGMATAAKHLGHRNNPAPLVLSVPSTIALNPASELTIRELVAGVVVPVTTVGLCRDAQSETVLHRVEVRDTGTEEVTVGLVVAPYAHEVATPPQITAATFAAGDDEQVEPTAVPLAEGHPLADVGPTGDTGSED
jgi:hypothetical protein